MVGCSANFPLGGATVEAEPLGAKTPRAVPNLDQ